MEKRDKILFVKGIVTAPVSKEEQIMNGYDEDLPGTPYYIKVRFLLSEVNTWYENYRFHRMFPGFTTKEVITVEFKSGSYAVVEMDIIAFDVIMETYIEAYG